MSTSALLLGGGTWVDEEAKILNVNGQVWGTGLIEFRYVHLGYVGWRHLALHSSFPNGVDLMLHIAVAACVSGRTVRLYVSNEVNPDGESEIMGIQFWAPPPE